MCQTVCVSLSMNVKFRRIVGLYLISHHHILWYHIVISTVHDRLLRVHMDSYILAPVQYIMYCTDNDVISQYVMMWYERYDTQEFNVHWQADTNSLTHGDTKLKREKQLREIKPLSGTWIPKISPVGEEKYIVWRICGISVEAGMMEWRNGERWEWI